MSDYAVLKRLFTIESKQKKPSKHAYIFCINDNIHTLEGVTVLMPIPKTALLKINIQNQKTKTFIFMEFDIFIWDHIPRKNYGLCARFCTKLTSKWCFEIIK